MKWSTEITNKGAELIAQAVASGDMVFTKAVGSSTLSGAADLKTVTEVSQPQYELKLKSIEAAGNSTRLTVRLLNDGVDEAYTIRQVGIYGKLKDDSEETLISISENSVGETVPSTTTIPEWVCDLTIVLNMDNTIKPTINIPSGVYALKTDIPTTLPANGGNADTVDGLHETSFPHNRGDISDCDNAVLPGTYSATPETINTPYSAYWFVSVEIRDSGTWIRQTATICDISKPNETYCRLFINDNWSDSWIKINDGGNADTLDGLHANEIASNPNLLDNPDFKINQRGLTEYTGTAAYTYTVDRWNIWKYNCDNYGTVIINEDGSLSIDGLSGANDVILSQLVLNGADLVGKTMTYSINIEEIDGSIQPQQHYNTSSTLEISKPGIYTKTFTWLSNDLGVHRFVINNTNCTHYKIKWVKLELGAVATPFIAPNPVEELLKIQSMNDDGSPKLISNDLLPTVVNSQMISNPNLLDNPDFKINQRGLSEYTTSSGYTYTVDRWYASSSLCKVNLQGNGIAITMVQSASVNSHELWQIFETPLEPGSYSMSLKVESVTGIWSARFRTVNSAGEFASSYYTPTLKNGVNNLSVDIPDGEYISSISVGFDKSNEVDSSIVINWIKVESGPVATPFVPPNPATELAKCQRYLLKLNGDLQTGMLYGTNSIWFLIPGFNMRTTPSIEKNNLGIKVTHGSDGTIITDGLSWSVDVAKESGVVLRMTKTNHGYTDTTLHGGTGDNFTLLSADM